MNAGALHQLHNAREEHLLSVADGVHLHLLAHDIAVNEHRALLVDLHGIAQIPPQHFFIGYDLHGPAAQDEAGPHQHGIANALRCRHTGFNVRHGLALRVGNVQGADEGIEGIPVLRLFNGGAVRADDVHPPVRKALGQIHRRLAAQRDDDPQGLLQMDDIHHVFRSQWLKIQLVRSGIVCGDGFRVVVDDNGLVARAADGPQGMDGGIVELHALANADGAGAQDDDLLPVRDHRLILLGIGGVEIGHVALKLAGAGIDHLVHREEIFPAARFVNFPLRCMPQSGNPSVGEAQALCLLQVGQAPGILLQLLFELGDVFQLAEEENADGRGIADSRQIHAPVQ